MALAVIRLEYLFSNFTPIRERGKAPFSVCFWQQSTPGWKTGEIERGFPRNLPTLAYTCPPRCPVLGASPAERRGAAQSGTRRLLPKVSPSPKKDGGVRGDEFVARGDGRAWSQPAQPLPSRGGGEGETEDGKGEMGAVGNSVPSRGSQGNGELTARRRNGDSRCHVRMSQVKVMDESKGALVCFN